MIIADDGLRGGAAATFKHGAIPEDWRHFARTLGLEAELLPVVSDPAAVISARSGMREKGKVPSLFNQAGEAVGMTKWPQRRSTDRDIGRWSSDSRLGICLQARRVKAFDIDIADPVQSAAVADMIEMGAGALPTRGRPNSGKRLLAFRLDVDFPKRVIKTVHGNIELLSTGQQFIAVGTHPSGARYEWAGGLPAEIPTLTMAEVDIAWAALVVAFALPDGASEARSGMVPTAPRRAGDMQDPAVAWLDENGWVTGYERDGKVYVRCPWEQGHSTDSGRSSTAWLPAGVGDFAQGHYRCLHASCAARTDGDFLEAVGYVVSEFNIVELDEGQAKAAAAAAIRNAQRPPARRAVVLETGIERAKRIEREKSKAIGSDGERVPLPTQRLWTGSEMLEELVLLEEGTRVSRVSDPRYVLPFEEFKKSTAGSVETTKNAAGRAAKVHRAQLWLESPDRKSVRTQTFAPGREGLCRSPDNVPAQNLWVPRTHVAPSNWRDLSAPFFGHVEYLVPAPAERERFLDWLAHIEQAPGTLPSTHYLMVAQQTGIGRNWLAYALARAFAGHTALGFDLGAALRSGFNGTLSMKLLAVVDELHEGGPGGAHTPAAEKLKSMLTEATRLINPKHGRQHVEFNCARFLMFSNHAAALPLADNDRRVIVIENPSERRSEAYFIELYALLDEPEFGAALVEAFRHRDISPFNPGAPAPMTAAKARTIRAGRSEIEQAVRDVAAEWPSACITSSRLTYVVGDALGGRTWSTQGACVAAGLAKYPGRVKVSGVPSHVWVLRDHADWMSAEPAAVATETVRGEASEGGEEFG